MRLPLRPPPCNAASWHSSDPAFNRSFNNSFNTWCIHPGLLHYCASISLLLMELTIQQSRPARSRVSPETSEPVPDLVLVLDPYISRFSNHTVDHRDNVRIRCLQRADHPWGGDYGYRQQIRYRRRRGRQPAVGLQFLLLSRSGEKLFNLSSRKIDARLLGCHMNFSFSMAGSPAN